MHRGDDGKRSTNALDLLKVGHGNGWEDDRWCQLCFAMFFFLKCLVVRLFKWCKMLLYCRSKDFLFVYFPSNNVMVGFLKLDRPSWWLMINEIQTRSSHCPVWGCTQHRAAPWRLVAWAARSLQTFEGWTEGHGASRPGWVRNPLKRFQHLGLGCGSIP